MVLDYITSMIPGVASRSGRAEIDLPLALQELQAKTPAERVKWAEANFPGESVVTTSFGAQSAAFLHLVSRAFPNIPVVFIDTGYHFPETLSFAQELTQRLNLNLKTYRPLLSPAQIEAQHGQLWEKGPEGLEKFHEIIRVEPLRRALRDLNPEIWIAGLRHASSESRQKMDFLTRQDARYKFLPVS